MNAYKQILINEYGKSYANAAIKDARQMVKLSNQQSYTPKQREKMDRMSDLGFNRATMLAVTAVLKDMANDQTTINEYTVLGHMFSQSDWRELELEGLVQWFRVAHPYQFVFLA